MNHWQQWVPTTTISNLNCVQVDPIKEEGRTNCVDGDNSQLISLASKPLKKRSMDHLQGVVSGHWSIAEALC